MLWSCNLTKLKLRVKTLPTRVHVTVNVSYQQHIAWKQYSGSWTQVKSVTMKNVDDIRPASISANPFSKCF